MAHEAFDIAWLLFCFWPISAWIYFVDLELLHYTAYTTACPSPQRLIRVASRSDVASHSDFGPLQLAKRIFQSDLS